MPADCPNRRAITLAQWDAVKKGTVEEEKEAQIEPHKQQEEEITVEPDEGRCSYSEEYSTINRMKGQSSENIFHSRYTVKEKVCSIIIDGGSCANVVSVA